MAPVPKARDLGGGSLPSWGAQCPSAASPLQWEMDLEVNPEAKGHTDSEHPDCQGS